MKALLYIVTAMLWVLMIPVRIVTGIQYLIALVSYPKKVLTLEKRWGIGRHVIDNATDKKCIVLRTKKIDRGRCPAWYKTYVAIKPSK